MSITFWVFALWATWVTLRLIRIDNVFHKLQKTAEKLELAGTEIRAILAEAEQPKTTEEAPVDGQRPVGRGGACVVRHHRAAAPVPAGGQKRAWSGRRRAGVHRSDP